ncbi:alpha/beta fold hydrolase [Gloeocapsa sp. PCC 73106]|uniref:alpha/beta fold hydrolase n=1 Tax=Gloeocapsa sp. PCC 73106 TaxID=102232 RepID=UPI0002AD0517|nr:alpha/beta fold hydrolase [Gloeocapsa sp. PCC 73106]ELR98913.1 putative hydrolase or acyltransferase of alpha/beta superfamily [Gloeocapsa sp. PCC 73106]
MLEDKTWNWQGFPITYQNYGEQGPGVILIHGFGASWRHWRKNLPVLGQVSRCYALDLIGFGNSAKPTPGKEIEYTFETWGQQVGEFCEQVVGTPAFFVGNSIGSIVAMQSAIAYPDLALGVAGINCSLRLLHERKRLEIPWYRSQGAAIAQLILGNATIGNLFFRQIARPQTIKKILLQAYQRQEAVSDELIEIILKPAQDPGASDVFRAFTRYSQGPLPEDLLPNLPCEAILLWGTKDPWEPLELGRELAKFPTVKQFIELEGLGHCPQDEAPEIVNPILQQWFR